MIFRSIMLLFLVIVIGGCSRNEVIVDDIKIEEVIEENVVVVEDSLIFLTIDNLKELGVPYIKHIEQYSKIYSLYPGLVASIIKAESNFRHDAKSMKNAIGLMQIIPDQAGREVNKLFFKNDEPIDDSLLYDPSFNIRVGCAYIYYLKKYYFVDIEDEMSKRYFVIAAYNMGVGKLVKTLFNEDDIINIENYNRLGDYEKLQAKLQIIIDNVNQMNRAEVKEYLTNNLLYNETVDYLDKVVSCIDEWLENVEVNI